jgi:hypothetical protein
LPDRQTKALITQIFSLKASSLMIFRPMDFLSATLLTALPRLATVKKSLSAVEHNLHFWMSHQNCSAGQRRLPPAAGI